jgi:carbonic anhydrase
MRKSIALALLLVTLLSIDLVLAEPTTPDHHQTVHEKRASVPSATALQWLKNGNSRFRTGKLRSDGLSAADRTKLSTGQNPHSIVLSCSDSRVPPELVFDEKLGEIFTVRTAGESLDSSVIASIEYAVEHLGPQLIVVLGHTECGAVKAALSTSKGGSAGSPDLDKLVHDIQPRLDKVNASPPSAHHRAEGTANARGVASDLASRSKILERRLKEGTLQIVPALYDLESGAIEFMH